MIKKLPLQLESVTKIDGNGATGFFFFGFNDDDDMVYGVEHFIFLINLILSNNFNNLSK